MIAFEIRIWPMNCAALPLAGLGWAIYRLQEKDGQLRDAERRAAQAEAELVDLKVPPVVIVTVCRIDLGFAADSP